MSQQRNLFLFDYLNKKGLSIYVLEISKFSFYPSGYNNILLITDHNTIIIKLRREIQVQ